MVCMDKIPPYSEEAERGVLGSILLDAEKVIGICSGLGITSQSFYVPAHQSLFDMLLGMNPHSVDVLTAGEEASRSGVLEKIGGHQFIEGLLASTPTAAHSEYYAGIVAEKADARALLRTAQSITNKVHDGDSVSDIITEAQQSISTMRQLKSKNDESLWQIADRVVSAWENPSKKTGVVPRWTGVSRLIGTIPNGSLVYISGRPSQGKTTLATNQAAFNIAAGIPTAFATLEMTRDRIVKRMIADIGSVPVFQLELGGRRELIERARKTAEDFKNMPMYIADWPMSVDQLAAWARHEKRKHGIRMLLVDRIELLRAPRGVSEGDLITKTSVNSGLLQNLGKELDVPVVVLSQLNRQCEIDNVEPELFHLRQSGSLEQDATMVMLIFRDLRDPDRTWLKIAKSQDTRTGRVPMKFLLDVNRLVEDMDYYKSVPVTAKEFKFTAAGDSH